MGNWTRPACLACWMFFNSRFLYSIFVRTATIVGGQKLFRGALAFLPRGITLTVAGHETQIGTWNNSIDGFNALTKMGTWESVWLTVSNIAIKDVLKNGLSWWYEIEPKWEDQMDGSPLPFLFLCFIYGSEQQHRKEGRQRCSYPELFFSSNI